MIGVGVDIGIRLAPARRVGVDKTACFSMPIPKIQNRPNREEQRYLVRVWDRAGPEMERIRREELRGLEYRGEDVDALLDMGASHDGPPRMPDGLIEMQKGFMQVARKLRLLPSGNQAIPPAPGEKRHSSKGSQGCKESQGRTE